MYRYRKLPDLLLLGFVLDVGSNGATGCGCNSWTKNDNRIFVIDTVLTPPTN